MYRLKTNFTLYIAGPSQSGKTQFCVQLLNNRDRMFDTAFEKVYWILGDPNAAPKNLNIPVEYIIGMPDEFTNETGRPCLYILDDSMFESQTKSVANLFTRSCHHQNISVIFITQNLFQQGKYARDMSLNSNYFCVMRNPRDPSQFKYFARQVFPEAPSELFDVYKRVTEKPFSYLFIDLNQTTHPLFRFLTNIFSESHLECYCSHIPEEINNESVKHEICGEGGAYTTYFKEREL